MKILPRTLLLVPISFGLALAQTVTLIPNCAKPGDKVCISGSGWVEPQPFCHYTFALDGVSAAPDQPDGLFSPPNTAFNVPSGTANGDHTVHVELRLDDVTALLQQLDATLRVVASPAATSQTTAGSGTNSIAITYTAPDKCITSCKRVVFIQTVRRSAVRTSDSVEIMTTATDWTGIPNAAKKSSIETTTSRMRVDMDWGQTAPYYTQGDNGIVPVAGSNAGFGIIGGSDPASISGTMNDIPANNYQPTVAGVAVKEAILRYTSVPLCIEGQDQGKYLGFVTTWEDHQTASTGPTISNVVTSAGQPSAEFLQAVANWNTAKAFTIPAPKTSPCP